MPQPPAPQRPTEGENTVGIIALAVSILGLVFACVKGVLIVGWILLPVAFILGIVALFKSGRARWTGIVAIIVSVVGAIVGAIVFATAVTDSIHSAFGGSSLSASQPLPSSPTDASSPTTSVVAGADSPKGSRENPFKIGETVSNHDWKIRLGVPHEAWSEISATNEFNDPPKAGMEFWMVPVTAEYTGNATGNVQFGVTVKFVGSDNRTYGDSCGVIPNPLSDVGDLYKDGVANGNTCVAVPAGADGLWTVSTGFIGTPAFFTAR